MTIAHFCGKTSETVGKQIFSDFVIFQTDGQEYNHVQYHKDHRHN